MINGIKTKNTSENTNCPKSELVISSGIKKLTTYLTEKFAKDRKQNLASFHYLPTKLVWYQPDETAFCTIKISIFSNV